jgi:hypothetical protein
MTTIKTKNTYENTVEEFNKRKCKLLDSKEEFDVIKSNSKKSAYKLNYIASCGHTHKVYYNVFKSRNTGIVCHSCKNKEIGKNIKEKMNNNEISKSFNTEQEFKVIKEFQNRIENYFNIIKAFDGCMVDIIFKPKSVVEDKWVGIQVKTGSTYSFHINNNYTNCLLLLFCVEDNCMWLIPENIIVNQSKITIGYKKSKYNIYKVNNDDIGNKLNELYNKTSTFQFDTLNTPINIYQHREQIFRKYREEKIPFIKFKNSEMEATVSDFTIGNLKIQEKVSKPIVDRKNTYSFTLRKHDGMIGGKRSHRQYDIDDNDFYWLNFDNKKTFFVIPENVLVEKGIVGNKIGSNSQYLRFSYNDKFISKNSWLQPYMFDYETIHDELNKNRLCNLLRI